MVVLTYRESHTSDLHSFGQCLPHRRVTRNQPDVFVRHIVASIETRTRTKNNGSLFFFLAKRAKKTKKIESWVIEVRGDENGRKKKKDAWNAFGEEGEGASLRSEDVGGEDISVRQRSTERCVGCGVHDCARQRTRTRRPPPSREARV